MSSRSKRSIKAIASHVGDAVGCNSGQHMPVDLELAFRQLGAVDESFVDLFTRLLHLEKAILRCDENTDEALYRGIARARDSLLLAIAARDAKSPADVRIKFQAFNLASLRIPEHGLLETLVLASIQADVTNLQIQDMAELCDTRGQ